MNDPLDLGAGILGNIAQHKVGEIVNDTINDPRTIVIKGTDQNPLEHIIGVPVLEKDELTGLVVVWRNGKANEFKPSDLDFLAVLPNRLQRRLRMPVYMMKHKGASGRWKPSTGFPHPYVPPSHK